MAADIINMFPLSVYRDRLDLPEAERGALLRWVREMRASADADRPAGQTWNGDVNGFESIHGDGRFSPLAGALGAHVEEYLGALGVCAEAFDMHLVRSWATVSNGRERIATHSHLHAHVAAVYYLRLPPGSARLGFGAEFPPNELAPNLFDEASLRLGHLAVRNPFNCREVYLEVREGDVVLFPAKTPHFTVGGDEGTLERISIVSDIVLTLRDSSFAEHLLPGVATWRSLDG